ncbi:tetratricopeptide repeat protein [Myxococcota bacterium]
MSDPGDERHSRRRAPSATGDPQPGRSSTSSVPGSEPPSGRFAGEDFLFHLYRGSELLQDNCVEEAKEELERALAMQPRDPEGQALLGVVYFRLGLYPRAIEIYEDLVRCVPHEVAPRVNAGLCYLKTGQPTRAREYLEEVIRRIPDHKRAWGYLGLTYERLGELTKAQAAFEQAGQVQLARRMEERVVQLTENPNGSTPIGADLRRFATDAVQELDEDPSPFERAPATRGLASAREGRWSAIELGRQDAPPSLRLHGQSLLSPQWPGHEGANTRRSTRPLGLPLSAAAWAQECLLPTPPHGGAMALGPDSAVVATQDAFCARLGAVRALLPADQPFRLAPAYRRWRGRPSPELLGSPSAALGVLEGSGHILLGANPGARLSCLNLAEEFLYWRESLLLGFDWGLRYESGRLVKADGVPIPIVQLAGTGHAILEFHRALVALQVDGDQGLTSEADRVLGWTGRLLSSAAQAGTPAAAPPAALVTFSGSGVVFLELG